MVNHNIKLNNKENIDSQVQNMSNLEKVATIAFSLSLLINSILFSLLGLL